MSEFYRWDEANEDTEIQGKGHWCRYIADRYADALWSAD